LIACLPALITAWQGIAQQCPEKVLLGRAALIVEADDPVRLHRHVGDNETHAREQRTRMPFHFGDNPAGLVPRRSLILETAVHTLHAFWRTIHRALEQMCNLALKHAISPECARRRMV